jgi:kynureninase
MTLNYTAALAEAARLDDADVLAPHRKAFHLPEGLVYLDGNSLGPLPHAAIARMQGRLTREWGDGLIASWNDAGWFTKPVEIGDRIGRLIGAGPGQVVACDTTSVNLFKVAAAALHRAAPRRKVISERGNFPTDLYMLDGLRQVFHGLEVVAVDSPLAIERALDETTAVLVLTQVDFRTGRRHDMRRLTERAHAVGALVVWDLAHSAGAFPVALDACEADFAVGCTYKYLNAGPGSPAFLYVAKRHQAAAVQPLSGWIGHADPFAMKPDYAPAPGIVRFLTGTPPVLAFAPLEASLDVWEQVDMAVVRAKSVALTEQFIALVDALPAAYGLTIASPRAIEDRGSQVALRHPDGAYRIVKALIAARVVGDYRAPDILRFGFTPLTLTHADVVEAVRRLDAIMASGAWREQRDSRSGAVT